MHLNLNTEQRRLREGGSSEQKRVRSNRVSSPDKKLIREEVAERRVPQQKRWPSEEVVANKEAVVLPLITVTMHRSAPGKHLDFIPWTLSHILYQNTACPVYKAACYQSQHQK